MSSSKYILRKNNNKTHMKLKILFQIVEKELHKINQHQIILEKEKQLVFQIKNSNKS